MPPISVGVMVRYESLSMHTHVAIVAHVYPDGETVNLTVLGTNGEPFAAEKVPYDEDRSIHSWHWPAP